MAYSTELLGRLAGTVYVMEKVSQSQGLSPPELCAQSHGALSTAPCPQDWPLFAVDTRGAIHVSHVGPANHRLPLHPLFLTLGSASWSPSGNLDSKPKIKPVSLSLTCQALSFLQRPDDHDLLILK